MNLKRLILRSALLVPVILTFACAGPQRQPTPSQVRQGASQPMQSPSVPTPGIQQGTVAYPSPRAGSAYDDPSTGISTVASTIPGAGRVWAVTLGNVAIVGTTSADPAIRGRIAQQVRSSFPHIADVRFTSDPAQMNRLSQALSLIQTNRSVAPLLPELAGIGSSQPSHR